MPCDYSKYPKDWKEIRNKTLDRDGHKCKLCHASNYEPHWLTGSKVVLTIAHLNHDINDNRDYNLAALCQRCHCILDAPYRVNNANKTRKLASVEGIIIKRTRENGKT